MKTVVFANGEINDYSFAAAHTGGFIICCDGGVRHAYKLGITPGLILGDLDSAEPHILSHYKNLGVEIEQFPAEKDFTDFELALKKALDLGASDIYILGGTGGRLDHTIGNAHALMLPLKRNVPACLIDEKLTVRLISKNAVLYAKDGGIVSLVPLSSSVGGVSTKGLYYPLNGETLSIGQSRGISNLFTSDMAVVTIDNGYLLVIQTRE